MILGILGTILKIIGMILLCILFLLLFILFLLLFVPLRYRAQLFREGKNIAVHAQISYLFHLICLPVDFEDKKLKISLKVFGFTFFSNTESEGGKRKAAKKGKKKVSDKEDEKESEGQEEGEEQEIGEAEAKEHPILGTVQIKEKPIEENQVKQKQNSNETNETKSKEGEEISIKKSKPHSISAKIAKKLRILYKKLVVIYQKIRRRIKNIFEKISSGKEKLADLRKKMQLIFTFLRDEQNKNGIKYAGKSILQLLKYVLPYKIEGELVFATGDAYSMGRALSYLGMLYPLYGKQLTLTADFEADAFRLEGRMQLAGRIRFCRILWIAFKLWRKGKILTLVSSAKELKHKLTTSAL